MRIDRTKSNVRTRGSSLALVVVVLTLLITIGVGLLGLDMQSRLIAIRTIHGISARTAADAGLEKAIFGMNQQLRVKPWSDTVLPAADDEILPEAEETCEYSYAVTGDRSNGYSVHSVGNSLAVQREVDAKLRLKSLWEFALFTKERLLLRAGTTITGYNFPPGSDPLKVGTNSIAPGSVEGKLGVKIDGDVLVGMGGDPAVVLNPPTMLTGDAAALPEEIQIPIIPPPDELRTAASKGAITNATVITTSGKYDRINIGNSATVLIDGPVSLYVTGSIVLDNSASIQINKDNPNASLVLYLGSSVVCQNGGFINNLTMDPKRLLIFGQENCTTLNFKTAGILYAAIYAPNADILSHSSVQIYGAVVADSYIQDVWAALHYDASLRKADYDDVGVRFVGTRWSEN